jgi:Arc/MetJ-type ribon-helix-helix transcriptional regulator
MRIVTVKLPEQILEEIDRLVDEGRYANRSDFIRMAVREMLNKEYEKKPRAEPKKNKNGVNVVVMSI